MLPAEASVPTWAPLTYSRCVVPSNVAARCVQAPEGIAAVPSTMRTDPTVTCDCGRPESELLYKP